MYQAGLILEGGGMTGVYTSGVLDFFLDKKIEFSTVYGVSMGACNMCSYLSKQRGRGYCAVADYLDDKKYCGFHQLLLTGDIFNAKMCYEDIPEKYNPFDHKTFNEYTGDAIAVMTDVETGDPVYYKLGDMHKDIKVIQASASMPLVSRIVEFEGRKYLDGGIADCVPVVHSLKSGNRKNVVVLTKAVGYVRKPFEMLPAIKLRYHKYPNLIKDMVVRHTRYNRTMEFIEREEKNGNLFVIRPQYESKVGRIEKNEANLRALYEQGYVEAQACYERMLAYLEK